MSADGTMDLDKSLEDIPDDMPDRDKIIESVKSCITESTCPSYLLYYNYSSNYLGILIKIFCIFAEGIDDCETANKIQKCFVSKVT